MNANPKIQLVFLNEYDILGQLHLEEALLRADNRNWCLVNLCPTEAIVMGISVRPEQVVDLHLLRQKPVHLIRRFTGGGTVFIDQNCLMATFICNPQELDVPNFPMPVFQWSEKFYKPIFQGTDFKLNENDYVIGSKKFGGNAQYMAKNRWLHHTSFLWDCDGKKMQYLKMPPKMPQYRKQRSHEEFLCTLSTYFSDRIKFVESFFNQLKTHFEVCHTELSEVLKITQLPHRKVSAYCEVK